MIPGPADDLEAIANAASGGSWALLCPPHPLYGGSMYDAVLDTIEHALAPKNIRTPRFNFRRVGASEGEHDNGDGEVHDLVAVVDWLLQEKSQSAVLVVGYSFGSVVASQGVAYCNTVSRVVLIAPPTSSMVLANDVRVPARVIVGDADRFVDLELLDQWRQNQTDAKIVTIPWADHFFGSQQQALQSVKADIFSEALHP